MMRDVLQGIHAADLALEGSLLLMLSGNRWYAGDFLRGMDGFMTRAKVKVMVPLRDRASAGDLTNLACELASQMGGELIALHVVEIPLATPLEAKDDGID